MTSMIHDWPSMNFNATFIALFAPSKLTIPYQKPNQTILWILWILCFMMFYDWSDTSGPWLINIPNKGPMQLLIKLVAAKFVPEFVLRHRDRSISLEPLKEKLVGGLGLHVQELSHECACRFCCAISGIDLEKIAKTKGTWLAQRGSTRFDLQEEEEGLVWHLGHSNSCMEFSHETWLKGDTWMTGDSCTI